MKIRASAPYLLLLGILGLSLGSLTFAGCDASEDPNLLNPPLPDSTLVRVVNLVAGEQVSLTLMTLPAATDLRPFEISSFSSFFFQEPFPIYVESFGKIDTLRDQRLSSGVKTTIHVTYLVTGNAEGRRVIPLYTSSSEQKDLENSGNGRVYFVNAAPGETLLMKRGCRAGDTLYRPVVEMSSGGLQDVPAGEYALYLFKADGADDEASAHLRVEPGRVTYLVAADNGSGLKLYQLDASGSDIGPLTQAAPETRTSADIQTLNGLDGRSITSSLVGFPTPLAVDLPTRTISPSVSIEACMDSNGDTLEIVTDQDDTTKSPLRVGVGTRTLAAVYSTNSATRVLLLDRSTFTPEPKTVYVRGVNLSRTASSAAVVIGAGAPEGVAADLRPFGTLKTGDHSNYVPLPIGAGTSTGLYPLSLQKTENGAILTGGLQNLTDGGFYTMLIMEQSGSPAIYFVRDDVPGATLQPLEAPGRNVLFFSMATGDTVNFEALTSVGNVAVNSIPYSYVFPTILPTEQVTISSPGIGSTTVDLSTEGYTIGATGTAGNYQLVSFPLPSSQPNQTKAGIRFLNAVPGAGPFNVRISSQQNPIETNLTFGVPSNTTLHDPRRYSFTITLPTNDTIPVALIQGVQLSGGRNYLLIVGPKGATSSSSYLYGTLWMQE